jgi:hypothetical protein
MVYSVLVWKTPASLQHLRRVEADEVHHEGVAEEARGPASSTHTASPGEAFERKRPSCTCRSSMLCASFSSWLRRGASPVAITSGSAAAASEGSRGPCFVSRDSSHRPSSTGRAARRKGRAGIT